MNAASGYGLLIALAVICPAHAGWAWYSRRQETPSHAWPAAVIKAYVFWPLVPAMVIGILHTRYLIYYLGSFERFGAYVLSAAHWHAAMVVLFVLGGWLFSRREWEHLAFFGLFVLPVFLLSRGAYLYFVRPEVYSDFQAMWVLIRQAVDEGRLLRPPNLPEADLLTSIYSRRIVPLWTPLALLLGSGRGVFQLLNLGCALGSTAAAYWLALRHYGKRPAQWAAWITLFIPELLVSMGIPSHDIWGAFLLMLFLVAYDQLAANHLGGYPIRAWGWCAAAGGLWLAAHVQRDFGIFLAPAVLFFAVLTAIDRASQAPGLPAKRLRRAAGTVLVLFAVPCMVYLGGHRLLVEQEVIFGRPVAPQRLYAQTTVNNWGGRVSTIVNLERAWESAEAALAPEDRRYFGASFYHQSLFSEYLYHGPRTAAQWFNKAGYLLSLGDSYHFYISKTIPGSPIAAGSPCMLRIQAMLHLFRWPFLAAGVVALVLICRRRGEALRAYFPLVVLGTFLLIQILIGEVQPRYAYPIYYILPIYMGAAWVLRRSNHQGQDGPPQPGIAWGGAVLLGLASLTALGLAATYAVLGSPSKNLSTWRVEPGDGGHPSIIPNALRASLNFGEHMEAGSVVRLEGQVRQPDGEDDAPSLVGMVWAPWPREFADYQRNDPLYDIVIRVDGEEVWRKPNTAFDQLRYFRIPGAHFPGGREAELEVTLEASGAPLPPGAGPSQFPLHLSHIRWVWPEE